MHDFQGAWLGHSSSVSPLQRKGSKSQLCVFLLDVILSHLLCEWISFYSLHSFLPALSSRLLHNLELLHIFPMSIPLTSALVGQELCVFILGVSLTISNPQQLAAHKLVPKMALFTKVNMEIIFNTERFNNQSQDIRALRRGFKPVQSQPEPAA